MSLTLYAHPFSSYCQKVLTALYENDTPFTYRQLSFENDSSTAELATLWPMKRFPVLVDDGRTIMESSIIIEHLDRRHPGAAPLLPGDADTALETRLMDRLFDNYVMTPMQRIVFDALRPAESRDAHGVAEAVRSTGLLDSAVNGIGAHGIVIVNIVVVAVTTTC